MLKNFAIKAIQSALWLIDPQHRQNYDVAIDDMKKFTHVVPQNFHSDFGHVSKAFRTAPYLVWELKTETKTLYAADRHRVIRADHTCAWLEDLVAGDIIKTSSGLERVLSCRDLGIRTHMYCVQVDTDDPSDQNNHLYYSDGILSHNTTCASAYLLWRAMFVPDTTILVVANKLSQALEIMERIRYGYENLPNHIRAGVTDYNKGNIGFDNGSRIISRATTSDAARGLAVSLLYADEFAFVAPTKQKEFFTSIQPTLAEGGGSIITSTPKNDEDMFAHLWKGAEDNLDEYGNMLPGGVGKNSYFSVKVPWWEHPERDEEWAKPFRESLGEARFRQEFECDFVTDDDTLINPLMLTRMKPTQPLSYLGTSRWYHDPEPNRAYLFALDPSAGAQKDYAAIQVFEMPTMIQVAEWQQNTMAARNQVRVLMEMMYEVHDTLRQHPEQIGEPEIYWSFENNAIGEGVLTIIEDTGEERFPGMLVTERRRKGLQMRKVRKGLFTSSRSKLSACARLKSLLESDRMVIHSANLIRELKNFVATETSFKAKPGEHDDLVMATVMIVRMLDIVLSWGVEGGDLREYITDDEMGGEPMPVVV